MAEYDFSTLGSSDLENLVCDLLNADLPEDSEVNYKTFKDGKDKGIDILYSSEGCQYNHVGQVKHYYRTGFGGLLNHLKENEVDKVKLLTPNRYIFATSVDLSVAESELIQKTFTPFIKSVNDIYGKKDINRLLTTYEAVLNRHYKLWFSDVAVLKKILVSDLFYRTADFVESELTRRIRVYVQTPVFDQAKISLENNNYVVITGEPGVGKTTLAEMLVYNYLKEDFELLYIHDDIKEVEKFIRDDDTKQIIYFDDFLGSNAVEINKAQGSETALISIIRRIKRHKNKRLIFTTRIHILNNAIDQSEKFKRFNIRSAETVFNLQEYGQDLKSQLLSNHIDEAEILSDLKSVLLEDRIFRFIVSHQSFNPRSVEYITTKENVEEFNQEEYRRFIITNFNNPQEIWSHAYRNQIGVGERLLLNTLLTFDVPVELDHLRNAYNKRMEKDDRFKHALEINAFDSALFRLDRGFIIFKNDKVGFVNPSLKDFLRQFLMKDPHEVALMLNSVKYIHQLAGSLMTMVNENKTKISEELTADILLNFEDYVRPEYRDHDLVKLAIIISNVLAHEKKKEILVNVLYAIDDWEALYGDYELKNEFLQFLHYYKHDQKIQEVLKERTIEIVKELFLGEGDLLRAVEQLEELKELFDLDFADYDTREIVQHLDDLFSEHISNEVDWLTESVTDIGEVYDKKAEVIDLQEKLVNLGLKYKVYMGEFDDHDWDEIARYNEFRRLMDKDD